MKIKILILIYYTIYCGHTSGKDAGGEKVENGIKIWVKRLKSSFLDYKPLRPAHHVMLAGGGRDDQNTQYIPLHPYDLG